MNADPDSAPTLCVVLPAHNELLGIESVIVEIVAVAERLVGEDHYEVIVVDDASTDGTSERLDQLAAQLPALSVEHLTDNVGHGPALRTGWERAHADWIVHLDSDGEIVADDLQALWDVRDTGELVLGVRIGRNDPLQRRVVTGVLRGVARICAGRRLSDANTPCKLVRRQTLVEAIALAPPDAFAPSILLAVAVARSGGRIVEVPVRTRPRQHGASWLVPTRLLRGSVRATVDTIRLAWRLR